MSVRRRLFALATVFTFPALAFSADGNAAKGKRAFANQCAACHTITAENRPTGPSLLGTIGRKSGTLPDYAFSEALKSAALTWTDESLDTYLADPTKTVPGTTMTLAVAQPATRADLIAYLKTLSAASADAAK